MTRSLTLGLFFGQILPASLTMMDQSVLSCDSVATGLEALKEVAGVVEDFKGTVGDRAVVGGDVGGDGGGGVWRRYDVEKNAKD